MEKISNWGNYPQLEAEFYQFDQPDQLKALLERVETAIPRGKGRCYGDSALSPQIISTLRFDKILAFEESTGLIKCQSGVTLAELLEVVVPRGWFLPVTPGTKFITIGGAIASDVHGKNQHKEGNFSHHVLELELMLADGTITRCSPTELPDLFGATCGGMGLTGVILTATFRLKRIESAYIRQETHKTRNLADMMDLFEQSEPWTYSMAWIDCLARGSRIGRGHLIRGEHATVDELVKPAHKAAPLAHRPAPTLTIPINLPGFALNTLSVKAFNLLYYHRQPQRLVRSIAGFDAFFYPLDAINHWNRIYGRRGFTQYQFVLPKEASRAGLQTILTKIAARGLGSFLAVLKLFGDCQHQHPRAGQTSISFPLEGYTLALDFPIRPGLFDFLRELDQLVLDFGGRVYLTKDVRLDREMFMRMYPNAQHFAQTIKSLNHNFKLRSLQSDRIGVTR
jgi:decaprenylphospho-beta-D-ribofuranose 2-oxidase